MIKIYLFLSSQVWPDYGYHLETWKKNQGSTDVMTFMKALEFDLICFGKFVFTMIF